MYEARRVESSFPLSCIFVEYLNFFILFTGIDDIVLFFFKGVADGVGGWRHYGIDPGEFSAFLMRTCERLVSSGRFITTEPAGLLARSYYELLESKQPILGADGLVIWFITVASLVCVLSIHAHGRTSQYIISDFKNSDQPQMQSPFLPK
jgi:hypothetical protein